MDRFHGYSTNPKFATKALLYNKQLTELARVVLGNIGHRSWQYGPILPSRSVSKRLFSPSNMKYTYLPIPVQVL